MIITTSNEGGSIKSKLSTSLILSANIHSRTVDKSHLLEQIQAVSMRLPLYYYTGSEMRILNEVIRYTLGPTRQYNYTTTNSRAKSTKARSDLENLPRKIWSFHTLTYGRCDEV